MTVHRSADPVSKRRVIKDRSSQRVGVQFGRPLSGPLALLDGDVARQPLKRVPQQSRYLRTAVLANCTSIPLRGNVVPKKVTRRRYAVAQHESRVAAPSGKRFENGQFPDRVQVPHRVRTKAQDSRSRSWLKAALVGVTGLLVPETNGFNHIRKRSRCTLRSRPNDAAGSAEKICVNSVILKPR